QVRKLAEWLRDWDDVVLKGKKKEVQDPKRFVPENLNAAACLVSGPPGIGKTTTCALVARCSRYNVMEFNASDARSKLVIDSMTNSLAGNQTLTFAKNAKGPLQRSVIIMDECDGMAGGDKGGIQALIKLIQQTKSPVICICNDRSDASVRQLASHCYDLKFRKPENVQVAKRITGILRGEGRKVEITAVEAVVEACGQDIRQVINHLQFFGTGPASSGKDAQLTVTPFDACSRLLSHHRERLTLEQRMDMYFVDSEFVPMLLQENYLRPHERRSQQAEALERAARAAELIATADGLSGNFETMGSAAFLGTVYPSALMAGEEVFSKPSFPTWLQKLASMNKNHRLVHELSAKVRRVTTCGQDFVLSYQDVLHRKMLKLLQQGRPKDCAEALHRHGLTRDFFTESPAFRQPLHLEDNYKKVDVQVRTRLLHEFQNLTQQVAAPKRRKKQEEDGPRRRFADSQTQEQTQDVAMEAAEDDDEIFGLVKKKTGNAKPKKSLKDKEQDMSKCSLRSWRPVKVTTTQQVEAKPLLVMKYIEGHTCSVRRKIHMKEILGSWNMF
ncbi:unnamed protein product, partial [Effrenium voratum]